MIWVSSETRDRGGHFGIRLSHSVFLRAGHRELFQGDVHYPELLGKVLSEGRWLVGGGAVALVGGAGASWGRGGECGRIDKARASRVSPLTRAAASNALSTSSALSLARGQINSDVQSAVRCAITGTAIRGGGGGPSYWTITISTRISSHRMS